MTEQRVAKVGIAHGYTGYTAHKCGCDICRAAFREYKQDYRRRQREDKAFMEQIKQPPPEPGTWEDEAVPANPSVESTPPKKQKSKRTVTLTATLLGVQKDLNDRNIYESAPGIAAVAERLACIIDNPLALPQAPAAAARLLDIYKEMGIQIKSKGGKLATIKSMMAQPEAEAS